LHSDQARDVLKQHGVSIVPDPVEWQHITEVDAPISSDGLLSSPAALLKARRQVVPFRGRTALLNSLHSWCDEAGFGAHLVHGPGGQGKTRLAQQLLSARSLGGWATLWLNARASRSEISVLKDAAKPLLVVLDYAETRLEQLSAVLEAAARHGSRTPFKILLLARTAGEWWSAAHSSSSIAGEMLDGAGITALPELEPEIQGRKEAYLQAIEYFSRALPQVRGQQNHDWRSLAANLITPTVDSSALSNVLTLHMTALADLLDVVGNGSESPSEAVEDRLLIHERHYWTTTAATFGLTPGLSMDTLSDALAAAFLCGAQDAEEGEALLNRVPSLADQTHDRRSRVRYWIESLYPAYDRRPWDTLQPDRLAEHFIGRHFDRTPGMADQLVPSATSQQATQMLTFYSRAATHPAFQSQLDSHITGLCVRHPALLGPAAITAAIGAERPDPLLRALYDITSSPDVGLQTLQQLADCTPESTFTLLPWVANLYQTMINLRREATTGTPAESAQLGSDLNKLSRTLGQLRKYREAYTAASEAVDMFQELERVQPGSHQAQHVRSLIHQIQSLVHLEKDQATAAKMGRVIKVIRRLARASTDDYRHELAAALDTYSAYLWNSGKRGSAVNYSIEATNLMRDAARSHGELRHEFAISLHNLSVILEASKKRDRAIATSRESVEVLRELSSHHPDKSMPDLAVSLEGLALLLVRGGEWDEAQAVLLEATNIHRDLLRRRPDEHRKNHLAERLVWLSFCLKETGKWKESLAVTAEAISIRETVNLDEVQK
jgi:tetratricopeptide (TPR) repeat protein